MSAEGLADLTGHVSTAFTQRLLREKGGGGGFCIILDAGKVCCKHMRELLHQMRSVARLLQLLNRRNDDLVIDPVDIDLAFPSR